MLPLIPKEAGNIYHSRQSGSIARADSAFPLSATSQPNGSRDIVKLTKICLGIGGKMENFSYK